MSLKFLVKFLLHSFFFFTDHLKHKTVNKTTCRMHSANLYQICANEWKSFPTPMIMTPMRLSGFPNFLGKVFLITFKFS